MNASNKILVQTLRHQSEEIAHQNIAGWGNTMSDAADVIEAQDMDNDFLDKQLAALRARIAELEGENRFLGGVIAGMENTDNERIAELEGVEQAARLVADGWNKGGIKGAPDVIEMQRRMLKLAAALKETE